MMSATIEKPKRSRKAKAAPADFQHDALVIRTVAPDDTAFGGFQWPNKVGELVECPDWNALPRCRLLYRGDKNGALAQIVPALVKAIQGTADAKLASGRGENAAATGNRGHAAATGYRGHAAATGKSAIAASLGYAGTAQAGQAGAIVLAYFSPRHPYALERVGAFMVGQDGIEPGKTYRLGSDGKPVEAA